MKKIIGVLFSSRLMAVIIAIFAISIAVATFIENDFGSPTARAVIYNSWWFELMLWIGIVNLTGTIFMKRLYRREKFTIFMFHLAFLFILFGAAITRYTAFEGVMHIREGEASNEVISNNTYLSATARANGQEAFAEKPLYYSALSNNNHQLNLAVSGKKVLVECIRIIPNAVESAVGDQNGEPILELVFAGSAGKQTVLLSNKQSKIIGSLSFSFNDTSSRTGIRIFDNGQGLQFKSDVHTLSMSMATQIQDSLQLNVSHPFMLRTLYNFGGIQVVAKNYFPSGKIEVTTLKDAKPDEYPDALQLYASSGGQTESVFYFANRGALNPPVNFKLNDVSLSVSFGAKQVQVPFSLQLKKFIIEHYPGSNSPSWFESRIVLKDASENVNEDRRIFMNNVLKYKGYRFYQSSYDPDEHGTILSVNHDYWGTVITYLGYLMLALGFILSLLNKNSRFRKLSVELTRLRELRRIASGFILLVFVGSTSLFSQTVLPDSVTVSKDHAARFGELLIQDPGGRIKPINTLSSELIRKVSRKTEFLGQTSDQVLLGMMVYPEFWQQVPMIKVSHPEIQKILHREGSYVSFADVVGDVSGSHPYLLSKYVNDAYQKKPALRNQFDTEIIRLDERINLCYLIYTGDLLRIFPKPGDETKTWYTPVNAGPKFMGKDSLLVTTIVPLYFRTLRDASQIKNDTLSKEALGIIHDFQYKYGRELIPSAFKIKLEIFYNKINIFDRLGSMYGLVGFILLFFQFLSVFMPRLNLKPVIRIATALIILCFVVHMAGLASRWFISGHAPWSNAYESLIYIAFATMLAGIIFSRKSSMTLSVTALLAWLILFVAHLNWLDPEITNLVPVLKSYWLLIHVAIITASYGFMALGALLAFINLILMIVQSRTNHEVTGNMMSELSIIIEMTLIAGLYMLTTGMFLGGVWANESWGRYWGWDPKETWALVSVLVYAFISHMRMVPGLKSTYLFNLMALLGFSSIVMTYFGVNYYLSGMHSYAKGDPLPIPTFVYYTLDIIAVVAIAAWINQRRLKNGTVPVPV
jgi:cytochrome c-type biogenesis protein CcsB